MKNRTKINLELAAKYDDCADSYDYLTKISEYQGGEWLKRQSSYFKEGVADVLDLGCADGFVTKIMSEIKPEYQFDGLDFSHAMVQVARKNNIYRMVDFADLCCGLPKKILTQYDYILAMAFLEFIQEPDKLLQDIKSALKPDGLALMTFQKTSLQQTDSSNDDITYSFENKNAIKIYLESMQFKIIKIEEGMGYRDVQDHLIREYFYVVAGK